MADFSKTGKQWPGLGRLSPSLSSARTVLCGGHYQLYEIVVRRVQSVVQRECTQTRMIVRCIPSSMRPYTL